MSAPALLGRVEAPLLSPNEPEAQVVELGVEGYSEVRRGDVICVVETSKASAELESEWDGYTGPVAVRVGDRVAAGDVICEVFESRPDPAEHESGAEAVPADLKLSRSAERLAREAGVDLSRLPVGRFVTEADVRALIGTEAAPLDDAIVAAVGDRSLVVFGGGGHAKSLIDLLRSSTEYEPLCVADDAPGAEDVLGVPVVAASALEELRGHGLRYAVNAVGAIGRIESRIGVGRRLDELGFELPELVDTTAFVAASASLSRGVQVFAGAAVCSAAEIGRSAIVNTGAIVSHDCRVGAFTHIAPGALLAGAVEVGEGTLVGMGVTVDIGVRIGDGAIVGNGAVVNAHVPAGAIVQAHAVWPEDPASSLRSRD